MHNDAVVHLIEKLIVNPKLVGDEKSSHHSKDIKSSGMSMMILLTCVVFFSKINVGCSSG